MIGTTYKGIDDRICRVAFATRLVDDVPTEQLEAMLETMTLANVRASLGNKSPEYMAKQMHPVPDFPVVMREAVILTHCTGKVVLDIGASGPLHNAIRDAAKKCYGIDKHDGAGIRGVNLDDYHAFFPTYRDVEVVVCGEVLEHLSNPGWLLERLRMQYVTNQYEPCCDKPPLFLFSVPNAFSSCAAAHMRRGTENVNIEHVAWYSWRTLTTLLERHGFRVREMAWYKGEPRFAEGILAICE